MFSSLSFHIFIPGNSTNTKWKMMNHTFKTSSICMETAIHHHRELHISPLANQYHHHQSEPRNARTHVVGLAMPIRSLTLKPSSANRIIGHHRFQDLRLFCINTPKLIMAQETKNKVKNEEGEESLGKMSTPLPPPPEKPLPGDCCGSGCVRCVWDIYYEELEEYDRLYKKDDNNKGQSKPS